VDQRRRRGKSQLANALANAGFKVITNKNLETNIAGRQPTLVIFDEASKVNEENYLTLMTEKD
jgi:hypothetical protein